MTRKFVLLMVCIFTLTNCVFLGCGKKEEKGIASKAVDLAVNEIKGRVSGDVQKIAGYYLDYDHTALEYAVANSKSARSKSIAKEILMKVNKLENSFVPKAMSLKELQELTEVMDKSSLNTAWALKYTYDEENGNDVSKNCLTMNQKKWLALKLGEELKGAVWRTCTGITELEMKKLNPQDIQRNWEEVVACRERIYNYLGGKPVVYKKTTKSNTNTTGDNKNTKSTAPTNSKALNTTNEKSDMRDPARFGAMDKMFLGKWKRIEWSKDKSTVTIKEAEPQNGGYYVEIFFYRIADAKGYATIDGNKLSINKGTINDNFNFRGVIEKTNNGIRLTVTESSFSYIKPGTIQEYE